MPVSERERISSTRHAKNKNRQDLTSGIQRKEKMIPQKQVDPHMKKTFD
jgi:hypothetical protein